MRWWNWRLVWTASGLIAALLAVGCGSAAELAVVPDEDLDPTSASSSLVPSTVTSTTLQSTTTATSVSTTSTTTTTTTTTIVEAEGGADPLDEDVEVVREFMNRLGEGNDVDGAYELADPDFRDSQYFWGLTAYQWHRWWSGPEFGERSEVTGCVKADAGIICEADSTNAIERAAGLTNTVTLVGFVEDGLLTGHIENNRLASWYTDLFAFMASTYPDDDRCDTEQFDEEMYADSIADCFDLMSAAVLEYVAQPGYVAPSE